MASSPNQPNSSTGVGVKNPNALALLFHIPKTFSLIGAVFRDARVHWLPKIVFSLSLAVLLLALLTPETFAEIVGFIGLPLTAPFELLGIPVDGTIDWAVLGVAAFNLLRLFPSQVVGEHYSRIFGKQPNSSGKVVDSRVADRR